MAGPNELISKTRLSPAAANDAIRLGNLAAMAAISLAVQPAHREAPPAVDLDHLDRG